MMQSLTRKPWAVRAIRDAEIHTIEGYEVVRHTWEREPNSPFFRLRTIIADQMLIPVMPWDSDNEWEETFEQAHDRCLREARELTNKLNAAYAADRKHTQEDVR